MTSSEAGVTTEVTGTKSRNTEDLTETDEVRGDLNGSDSESSDSVKSSGAVVHAEDTGTKSQSTEDLSEADEVKSDQGRSDSEPSDIGTDSSPSRNLQGETGQISGASAPERAGASPDTGKVKPKNAISKVNTHIPRNNRS